MNVKDLIDEQLYELNFQLDFMRLKVENLHALKAKKIIRYDGELLNAPRKLPVFFKNLMKSKYLNLILTHQNRLVTGMKFRELTTS